MTDETANRFGIMTLDEMEEAHRQQLSTPRGAERYAESKYRRGYRDGYIAAINRIWELMFDEHMRREDAYNALWTFTQTGALAQWVRERMDTPGYMSYLDRRPPKHKAE